MSNLGRLIVRARRQVSRSAALALSERAESLLDWQIVDQLAVHGPSSQRELADAIGQHAAGVCRQLEELEGKSFTQRDRDPQDRRCSRVALTAKGRRWHELHWSAVNEAVLRALDPLSPEEQRTLEVLLTKLVGTERAPEES